MTDADLGPEGIEYSAVMSRPVRLVVRAAALVLLAAAFGPTWPLLIYSVMALLLIEAAIVDLASLRLPNILLGVCFGVGMIGLPIITVVTEVGSVGGALVGAALGFFGMLILHLLYPAGMGLGDVKLGAVMGLYLGWLGWAAMGVAFLGGIMLTGLCSGYLIWRDDQASAALPFGPFLVVVTIVSAAVYAV